MSAPDSSAGWPRAAVATLALLAAAGASAPLASASGDFGVWLRATHNSLLVALGACGLAAGLGFALGLAIGLDPRQAHTPSSLVASWVSWGGALPGVLVAGLGRYWDPTGGAAALTAALAVPRTLEVAGLVRQWLLDRLSRPYVEASRSLGARWSWTMKKHVLPGLGRPMLSLLASGVAASLGLEAVLSLVGLGLPARTPSWGSLLAVRPYAEGGGAGYLAITALPLACFALQRLADWLERPRAAC